MEPEMPSRWLSRTHILWIILILGLALRGYHYLRNRAVWHDEAVVLVNVLERDFGELLGPLRFHEAAPPLFLWSCKAAALTLGDSPFAFRLLPFLASCAALVLLVRVARRLLSPEAVPWAVLLFACSEQLLWHCCEAKPYALDVLVAVLVLAIWTRVRPDSLTRWLLVLAALAPVLIFFSYPACFVLGGVLLAALPLLRQGPRLAPLAAYGLFALTTGAAFGVLLLGPVRAQHDPVIQGDWMNCMPNWQRPWSVPGWTVLSTFEVWRYCCKPLGQPLLLVAVAGSVLWWRKGERSALLVCLVPIGLALVASFLHRYPFGGERVIAYCAAAVVLTIAAGTPLTLAWLRQWGRLAWLAGLGLLLLPLAVSVHQVVVPWREANIREVAEYVEAYREANDRVIGNDWTHSYYFRHLGSAFYGSADPRNPLGEASGTPSECRLWVVVTTHDHDHDQRMELARGLAPGWILCAERAFRDSSVGLFIGPETSLPALAQRSR
jgi:hypothetical protein